VSTSIAYTCKLCRQPNVAEIAEDAPKNYVDRLRPLLTCNPCFDRREKFRNAEAAIYRMCERLLRADGQQIERLRSVASEVLKSATRAYAEAMAEYRHLPAVVWSNDFVDMLIERPEKAGFFLKQYRDRLRKAA
jgi:hypothetical protein